MDDQDKPFSMEAIMRDQERRFIMNNIANPATGETQGGRPRICEVLGVEVGDRFDFCMYSDLYVDEAGYVRTNNGVMADADKLCLIINEANRIIRKPRFTEGGT